MKANPPSKLPTKSSTHSEEQLQEAKRNLEEALGAYNRRGEAALQEHLEEPHPVVDHVPFLDNSGASWMRVRRD